MINEPIYTGTYKVMIIFKNSNRRIIIDRNLTLVDAKLLANSYPDKPNKMVVFTKQFTSKKYFITKKQTKDESV